MPWGPSARSAGRAFRSKYAKDVEPDDIACEFAFKCEKRGNGWTELERRALPDTRALTLAHSAQEGWLA